MTPSAASDAADIPAARATYHHGDLRRALLEAGTDLAREGGPDKVVLREATRRVGVSANAAYRHFADRDALLGEVVSRAQARAADVISATMDGVPDDLDAGRRARARFRAVGVGYLRFAMDEPGLFRAAFAVPVDLRRAASPEAAGAGRDARPSSCSMTPSTTWPRRECISATNAREPSCSPGRRCTAWPCSPSRGRCATSQPAPSTSSPRGSSGWSTSGSGCPTGPAVALHGTAHRLPRVVG